MTITVLQHTSLGSTFVASNTLAFPSNVTAGSTILFAVRLGDTGFTFTVNDNRNAGNYTQDIVLDLPIDGDRLIIGRMANVAAGATTLTFTASSATKLGAGIVEVAGLATSSILDKTASATNSSTAPNSGNTATTTVASEFIYSAVALDNDNAETITGSGSTILLDSISDASTSFQCLAHGYQIVSSVGAYAGAYALTTSEEWACAVATYKSSGGGGTPIAVLASSYLQNL